MPTKIKICGIKDLATVQLCEQLGVDYLGFNLIKSSPRFIEVETMSTLIKSLQNSLAVAVILADDLERNAKFLAEESLHALQIYQANIEQLKSIKDRFNKKIIYPISVAESVDMELIESVAPYVDYLIFDSYQINQLGGTGKTFDWNLLEDFFANSTKQIFISGGLNAENVTELLRVIHPYAVDVASGVETAGQKDINKITKFVQKIRSYEK